MNKKSRSHLIPRKRGGQFGESLGSRFAPPVRSRQGGFEASIEERRNSKSRRSDHSGRSDFVVSSPLPGKEGNGGYDHLFTRAYENGYLVGKFNGFPF